MHTACDCSCKGSESGKAEAVTAEVGGVEFAQRQGLKFWGVGPHVTSQGHKSICDVTKQM